MSLTFSGLHHIIDFMEKKTDKITLISLFLLAVTVLFVYIINSKIPFMMDDLWYSTLLYSNEPVRSLSDIISAQVWHWNNWGGRSMTHGLLQIILIMGERAADILNTVFVLILSAVITLTSSISSGKVRRFPVYLLAGAGLLLGLNANWKMSMFWEAGAANYLYITVFIMLFLFCYLREVSEKKPLGEKNADPADTSSAISQLPGIAVWIIPLAILTGWSNENMGPTCFVISVLVMIILLRTGGRIRFWMIEGSVLSLAGSVMCIIAPGNFVRSSQIPKKGALWTLFLRCYSECCAAFKFQLYAVLTLSAILIISTVFCGIKLKNSEKLLLLATLMSWGAMILSPHYPDRATFGTMCLMICVIISRSALVIKEKKEAYLPLYLGFIIIWLKGMFDLGEFLSVVLGWI